MRGLGFGACAVIVLAAGSAHAASPAANAVKAIEAVGSNPAKFKNFCDLMGLLGVAGDQDDPDAQKELDKIIMDMSPEYGIAMDLREKLDAIPNSPDVRAIDVAIETLADKCPRPSEENESFGSRESARAK
jgi:hypothetical protein